MLGLRIKNLRKENDWNQTELANKIGVGRTTITEYERETITPPYEKIQALAKVFNVSVKYLMGESNSRSEEVLDQTDIAQQLNKMIDDLHNVTYSLKFNGRIIDTETKNLIATQLEQAIKMVTYLEHLNKGEQ